MPHLVRLILFVAVLVFATVSITASFLGGVAATS